MGISFVPGFVILPEDLMNLLFFLLLPSCSLFAAKKPNFIFILSDDIA
ncbi:MAG: hypothetical protein QNL68_19825 [Akkermansiaceae bacterium]